MDRDHVFLGLLVAFILAGGAALFVDANLYLERFGTTGPIAITVASALQVILAPIPPGGLSILGGYLYGPWLATLYVMTGIAAGSIIVFTLAKQYGRGLVERYVSTERIARYDQHLRDHGAVYLFIAFLLPFFPDDILCMLAGLTDMHWTEFLLALVLGRTPLFFIYSYFGANITSLTDPWFVTGIAAFLTIAVVLLVHRDRLRAWIDTTF